MKIRRERSGELSDFSLLQVVDDSQFRFSFETGIHLFTMAIQIHLNLIGVFVILSLKSNKN